MTEDRADAPAFLAGGGELGALMRAKAWSQTPLGGPDTWSPVLRSLVSLVLAAKQPMFLAWGPELSFLYNDAYAPIFGAKHPDGLGRPFAEVWSDIWEQFGPIVEATLAGEAQAFEDLPIPMMRHGIPETPFFSFSYTQLRDETDKVAGLFCAVNETTAKVLAEREAAAEKDRLRDLFEQAPGFMCVLRSPGHVFELTNAAYLQLIGHRDLIGKPIRDALPEVEGQGFFELLDRVYATGEAFVGRHLRVELQRQPDADKVTRYVDLVYQPIRDAVGEVTGIFVEGSDVTETHNAQEALRAERDRARLVLDVMGEGYALLDGDCRIVDMNAEALRMDPRPREEIVGRTHWEAYPEADPQLGELYRQVLAERTPARLEHRFVWDDGRESWLAMRAFPVGEGVGVFYGDITARKRAEQALQAAADTNAALAAEQTAILSQLAEGVIVADPDGRIRFVNEAAGRLHGVAVLDVGPADYAQTYHLLTSDGLPHPPETLPLARAVLHGETVTEERWRIRRPDGTEVIAVGSARPVQAPDGTGLGAVLTLRDDTARAQAEVALRELNETLEARVEERSAELRLAEEALRQAQKMEAVGQLTGGIAHDFNNLLQGITGSLDLVQKRIAQGRTGELDRFISGAVTSANRAAALTHRLLAFSRRQPLDPKLVNANPLVASMEDLLRRTLGESMELELVLAGGLWLTLCDANQLESAVLNLAINARDAMPGGGTLTIETCNAHLDGAYAARTRDVRPGQYVCICVTDTGTGMTREVVERAFDPFFTTKPLGEGTGLGLSMIYGFAQQSEGYCKIYSEVGQGTTVKLYLPRHRGATVEEEPELTLAEPQAAEHGEVIVVVEDESVVRGLVVEVLGELGYRALEAHDGPSGVALLERTPRVDLLITDIGLPGLNGRQVAEAARARWPKLKVLFMTGYAENAAVSRGFLEPGMSMLTKPFAMETLATRIRGIIEGTEGK
jgi:PAS domain S-box-containing protein